MKGRKSEFRTRFIRGPHRLTLASERARHTTSAPTLSSSHAAGSSQSLRSPRCRRHPSPALSRAGCSMEE
eukprot:13727907-Alexandrium_andersonii.AAC.1